MKIYKVIITLFIFVLLLGVVSADKVVVFDEKNQLKYVGGHEIVLLEATEDNECIITVDGKAAVILKGEEDTINDVKIYVKTAIHLRTKEKKSEYCELLLT